MTQPDAPKHSASYRFHFGDFLRGVFVGLVIALFIVGRIHFGRWIP